MTRMLISALGDDENNDDDDGARKTQDGPLFFDSSLFFLLNPKKLNFNHFVKSFLAERDERN